MTQMDKILHKFLGDTHHGRLVDKFGNFATENFGDKGLQFFNSLTACQVRTPRILANAILFTSTRLETDHS